MPHLEESVTQNLRFPNIFPKTRLSLEKTRTNINATVDPPLNRYFISTYEKMAGICRRIRGIF